MAFSLLLVDEDIQFQTALARRLTAAGFSVQFAEDIKDAMAKVEARELDLLVAGVAGEDNEILEAVRQMKAARPALEIILLCGRSSLAFSMKSMRAGAFDCLVKPTDIEQLITRIKEALKTG
ncbi:MAG: response regulator [Deltaproteobacteria bacterium]|nr:response regulator [Deltaproteobacteria bacterium]